MCFFCGTTLTHLEKHIVRFHRHNTLFKVNCTYDGCGVTYKKWKSHQQHVTRYHPFPPVPDGNRNDDVSNNVPNALRK